MILATAAPAQPLPAEIDGTVEAPEGQQSGGLAAARRLAQDDVEWIAGKTGWRVVSVPTIETRSDRQLTLMFFGTAEGFEGMAPLALYGREVHVLYLSDRLTFDNVIDRSILLHELVHHMEVLNGVQTRCREAAEADAYKLQIAWLTENGVADPYALLGIAQSDIDSLACP